MQKKLLNINIRKKGRCFDKSTLVKMKDQSMKKICDISINDELYDGSIVTGIMKLSCYISLIVGVVQQGERRLTLEAFQVEVYTPKGGTKKSAIKGCLSRSLTLFPISETGKLEIQAKGSGADKCSFRIQNHLDRDII